MNCRIESMRYEMVHCLFSGIEDSVKCFSCNGTLRNWERDDDPWREHARWFPRCNYVRRVKGEAFIRTVQTAYSGQVTRGHSGVLTSVQFSDHSLVTEGGQCEGGCHPKHSKRPIN